MSTPLDFSNDENGNVFRRMIRDGDDLSKPRMMDFCHIFSERQQALAFADLVDNKELEVCISYYEAREMWQVIVKKHMVPTHENVTELELSLASQAESAGGQADGWGCMIVKKVETK